MLRRLLIVACLALPALAQPSADWRTLSTTHFRIHYPRQMEAFAMRAASRLESVRDVVTKEVGFAPPQITDVLIENPYSLANGETIPLLDTPRMIFYSEPPEPESTIGEYRDWIDLLSVHETTHLVHLLRPSRNPQAQLLAHVLPLDPITLNAPRWVLEGYATLVEGRITGAGRPQSALRAAILRKFAMSGRMPSYGQLDSSQTFLGMSMAYLAGSAFLEWLEREPRFQPGGKTPAEGGAPLQNLWRRMTARHRRDFDEAFIGVFGDSPSRLYARFTAELTANAAASAKGIDDAPLWQETSFDSGDPAVSPDGSKLAMVLRDAKDEAKLVVFSTGPNEEEKKFAERVEKILKRDPEDVAPVRTKPLPRKPLQTLRLADDRDIESPRWTRDGNALIYTHRAIDRGGVYHRDLFRWTPANGRVERLTFAADVHDADPLPDGTSAVAVRNRDGFSQLVTVNLLTGSVAERTPPSLETVYSHPRASADGRIAWAEHSDRWRVVIDGRAVADDAFSPEWGKGGELYATLAARGFLDIVRVDDGIQLVAHSSGALEQPAPSPDGSLYFMSLEPDGWVVRHLAQASGGLQPAEPAGLQAGAPLAPQSLEPSHGYGIGRQEMQPIIGGMYARNLHAIEAGVRFGDVVGRLDTLLLGSFGDVHGAALATRWRGSRVNLALHLFERRPGFSPALASRAEAPPTLRGAEFRASWTAYAPLTTFTIDSGGIAGDDSRAFVDAALRLKQHEMSEELRVAADTRHHVRAAFRFAAFHSALTMVAARHEISLGGLPSSIIPDSLNIARAFDPVLDPSQLIGNSYRGARAETNFQGVTWFLQYHRLANETIRVAGAMTSLRRAPEPLVKAPALDFTLGIARVIDEHRTRAWIGIRWRT
jgi:hypothetical protein